MRNGGIGSVEPKAAALARGLKRRLVWGSTWLACVLVAATMAWGADRAASGTTSNSSPVVPIVEQLIRVVSLRDYNTRVVLLGTTLLGITAGLVGVFLLLRRRSLMADVISHTTFPGIAIAFLLLELSHPGTGKSTPLLLAGAFVSGLLGMACVTAVVRWTRIKEDAALAIVLSVFFGLGIALFTVVQSLPTGNVAGLGQFIYGKAASMVAADVWLIAGASLAVIVVFAAMFKEWVVVSFDDQFAASQGWPVLLLDSLLLTLVTTVTVIGLQSVGLLLVVAMMIIPATAARCWTHDLTHMTWLSALLGGLSALMGVTASAVFPRLAAGAVIVLAGSILFLFSVLLGARRGVLVRAVARRTRDRRIARDHLLRALFECLEPACGDAPDLVDRLTRLTVSFEDLLRKRSWTSGRLRSLIGAAQRDGYVVDFAEGGVQFTHRGASAACRVVRNHRLWELYL
ncbi:MAG: iron chelate uptake ABC transporter family permease subunit, partial [Pirellulaceae bacterium]